MTTPKSVIARALWPWMGDGREAGDAAGDVLAALEAAGLVCLPRKMTREMRDAAVIGNGAHYVVGDPQVVFDLVVAASETGGR